MIKPVLCEHLFIARLFRKITDEKNEQLPVKERVGSEMGYEVVCGDVSCIFEFEAYHYYNSDDTNSSTASDLFQPMRTTGEEGPRDEHGGDMGTRDGRAGGRGDREGHADGWGARDSDRDAREGCASSGAAHAGGDGERNRRGLRGRPMVRGT